MKEKKEIKMSLWTFFVLAAGIVTLIGAVIIGGFYVIDNASTSTNEKLPNDDKIIKDTLNNSEAAGNRVEEGKTVVVTNEIVDGIKATDTIILNGNQLLSY